MRKNYKTWMPVKAKINNKKKYPKGYKERDIWICSIGENIGFEEDGKKNTFSRPVLIIKVFSKQFCHIVPLSKTNKRGIYYHPFDGQTGRISIALLSQSKAIDSSRLVRKIGFIKKEDFNIIQKKIKTILEL